MWSFVIQMFRNVLPSHHFNLTNMNHSRRLDFIRGLLKKTEKKLARSFNFTFRYIDDVLSLINSNFDNFVDHIYTIELERKDNTYTYRSASYIDLHLEIDSEGRLRTNLYDKRDDFYFPIVNFSFICSKIPVAPAYGGNFPQSIRYSRACGSYQDFVVCNTITPTSHRSKSYVFIH